MKRIIKAMADAAICAGVWLHRRHLAMLIAEQDRQTNVIGAKLQGSHWRHRGTVIYTVTRRPH